jgi:hypothetical protein
MEATSYVESKVVTFLLPILRLSECHSIGADSLVCAPLYGSSPFYGSLAAFPARVLVVVTDVDSVTASRPL